MVPVYEPVRKKLNSLFFSSLQMKYATHNSSSDDYCEFTCSFSLLGAIAFDAWVRFLVYFIGYSLLFGGNNRSLPCSFLVDLMIMRKAFIYWMSWTRRFFPFSKTEEFFLSSPKSSNESKHEPDQFESMSKSWFLWPRISGCFNCFLFFVTQGHAHLVPDTKLRRESQLNQQIVGLQAKLQIAWLEKHFWES